MGQTEVILLSCCPCHSSCSTMCFCSVHYNNYGHVTPNRCLFVDFSWIYIYTGKVWSLPWQQWFPCTVWICFQKCLFWVCWGVHNLVQSQEQLWKARRGTPEGDEQPNKNLPEEPHQREKHQQLHLVAGEGGRGSVPGTWQKWVKHTLTTFVLLLLFPSFFLFLIFNVLLGCDPPDKILSYP